MIHSVNRFYKIESISIPNEILQYTSSDGVRFPNKPLNMATIHYLRGDGFAISGSAQCVVQQGGQSSRHGGG